MNIISPYIIATFKAIPFLVFICLIGCANSPKNTELHHSSGNSPEPILFVADPQIHNIYGLGLKQMLGFPDLVSKVAVRQPELNILAPIVLETLMDKSISTSYPQAIFVLGDVTNIACSGEYDAYIDSVTGQSKGDIPIIMAHGNHDSYLMGTVNHYFPYKPPNNWKPKYMESSPLPTDEGWWGNRDIDSKHYRNWRDGCYQPSIDGVAKSSPMNKSRWLAKYMKLLETFGMISKSTPKFDKNGLPSHYLLELSSKPKSILSSKKFSAKGAWFPPRLGNTPQNSNFSRTYKSFIVQSLDVKEARIVVIDTSVCEKARGGWRFLFSNAGQHACIGVAQLDIIREIISDTPKDLKLVLTGHFPLADLTKKERKELVKIASDHGKWIYISAHSHKKTNAFDWETGVEVNVGSTTDWPMESNLMWFQREQNKPLINTIKLENTTIPFHKSSINIDSEVCRHLPAALQLAELNSKERLVSWKSPKNVSACEVSDNASWNEQGLKLKKAISKIRARFKNDAVYRDMVLSIAASASKHEHESFAFVNLIP